MEIITMNKNIIRIGTLLLAALSFSLVACNRILDEVETVTVENGTGDVTEVLTLLNEPQTKATLGNEDLNPVKAWENGDLIGVWAGANATSGEFQNCSVLGGTITVNLYGGTWQRYNYAVYPYQYSAEGSVIPSYNAGTGVLSLNLPDTYDYAIVGGTKNPVPMVAKNLSSEGTDLTFYTVGALARISLSGIPSVASKLVVSFDKTVTGSFTVQDLATLGTSNAPYIEIDPSSAASTVTINLTPGDDYIGAAINIPVPQGTVNVISVAVYQGEELLMTVGSNKSKVIANWNATRAHGKKASVEYNASIGSLYVSPGKLYTDGEGVLHMADNWYTHMFVLSGAVDDGTGHAKDVTVNSFGYDGSYSIANRTHFNWNEIYCMTHSTTPTWPEVSDNTRTGAVNEAGSYTMSKEFNDVTWHVPSGDEVKALWGKNRPGAEVNGHHGWHYIKLMVTDMATDEGTTVYEDGTTKAQSVNLIGPSTTYQAGILFLPDNVVFSDVLFTTLSNNGNQKDTEYAETRITKEELNNKLIAKGCAFFPALGRWRETTRMYYVGYYVCYFSNTQYVYDPKTLNYIDYVNQFTATPGGCGYNNPNYITVAYDKKVYYDSFRLVRDLN